MPYFDRTGPRGRGMMTGGRRGPCAVLGAPELPSSQTIVTAERGANARELELWERAERAKQRAILWAYIARLKYQQIVFTAQFANSKGIDIGGEKMPELESRMSSALSAIESLRRDHCEVTALTFGVRLSSGGGDLDIVNPHSLTSTMGAIWIPIVIGAVVVAGIIARWAYLEKEVQHISDEYNGILHHANQALCSDPNSAICKSWTAKKATGAYAENETLIDSVQGAVSKVGGAVSKGIGAGIMIAIPLLMMLYLPKKGQK